METEIEIETQIGDIEILRNPSIQVADIAQDLGLDLEVGRDILATDTYTRKNVGEKFRRIVRIEEIQTVGGIALRIVLLEERVQTICTIITAQEVIERERGVGLGIGLYEERALIHEAEVEVGAEIGT